MRPCLVINFIVRTSKKNSLFVLFSYAFKLDGCSHRDVQ